MIRPIDLQTTIISSQSSQSVQRIDEAPRIAAQAAQAAFAAEATRRDEMVAPAAEVHENRIGAKPDEHPGGERQPRRHAPRTPFEQIVDDAAAASSEDAPHIVDFTA